MDQTEVESGAEDGGVSMASELFEALDNLQMQGVPNGGWVMVPRVEWDSIFARIKWPRPNDSPPTT